MTHKENNNTHTSHDVSPHASISFTAHYTGEMWQKLGLSHPALATRKGKRMHRMIAPVERFAKTFFGVTMGNTLTVRHRLIDQRIHAFLHANPDAQVVEIAAGLSPRGWRFLQAQPTLTYVEIDLPAMSALKQQRAQDLPQPVPQFFAADLLRDDLNKVFDTLDHTKPLLIVSEGLINYFTLELLGELSHALKNQLNKFSTSMWITENYPYSSKPSYNALVKVAAGVLRKLSKSSFSFYFSQPEEAANYFLQHGFSHVDVFQPSKTAVAENSHHLGDTVWVMELTPSQSQ